MLLRAAAVALLLSVIVTGQQTPADTPCCEECSAPLAKYYSIPKFPGNRCGETCMNPADFWKYKIFEPNLEATNLTHPCPYFGYSTYKKTEEHGEDVDLPVILDMYGPNNSRSNN